MSFDEIVLSQDIDLIDDTETDWTDDRSEPQIIKAEAEEKNEHELTNLRLLEWLHDLPADQKETILTIQDVDWTRIKYISHDNTESNWIAPDGPLCVPESSLDLLDPGQSTRIFLSGEWK